MRTVKAPGDIPAGTSPFATARFLEVVGDYGHKGTLSTGHPAATFTYLSQVFGAYPTWNLFSRWEPRGAGVADYVELDWKETTAQEFTAFLEAFAATPQGDIFVLPKVRDEGVVGRLLQEFAESKALPFFKLRYDTAPYVLLKGDWAGFYGRKRRKFRYNLSRAERSLDQMGGLSFTHATSPEDVERLMDTAFDIYQRRSSPLYRAHLWREAAGRAVLRRMAVEFARMGWADLTFLLAGDRPIAFCYGFHNEQDYFFYATAFDPDPRYAVHSPGVLLAKHLLERAFERGYRRFDFMVGDEPYKRTWATHDEGVYTYVLGKPSLRSRTAFWLYCASLRAKQRARRYPAIRALARRPLAMLSR